MDNSRTISRRVDQSLESKVKTKQLCYFAIDCSSFEPLT